MQPQTLESAAGRKLAVAANRLSVVRGSTRVFDDLSFSLPAGSFTALVGPNGSGKTTLFEVLLGLIQPRAGDVRVLGAPAWQARAQVAYVPQASDMTHDGQFIGREFVAAAYRGQAWGFAWRRREVIRAVDRALDQVGATRLARRRLAQLSGGQRQRLLIAQALVNQPRLIFMDEPLAQLDPGAREQIVTLAAELQRQHGITVLLSTHDVNPVVEVADQVLYLAAGEGRIGPIDEVVTDEVLSRLYGVPMHVVRARGQLFVIRDRQDAKPDPRLAMADAHRERA